MKKKLTDPQEFNSKLGAQQFLIKKCIHLKEKSPLKSVFARCLKCLSPSCMVKYSEAGEILFQKLLGKVVTRRLWHPLQMMQKWSILGLPQLLLRKT